ncbi:hypothetical protein [Rubellicoccus peritrichatus]|uniref:Uncharacterized protein n=1 Tax=Rubellicoccus peritrichatus TaxID=3080537 RepID=A0AAQ3QVU5_9BACT|nr:hypothetical protein [Puniceicoccus sp. CR14]WOO43681.1 hypothetical protein RZN69_11325 [Puniceicoccus sp. CR14]
MTKLSSPVEIDPKLAETDFTSNLIQDESVIYPFFVSCVRNSTFWGVDPRND